MTYKQNDTGTNCEGVDVTLPVKTQLTGKQHPISHTISQIVQILTSMQFSFFGGPDIESTTNNFDKLNIPEGHPSRRGMDTIYLDEHFLLRTHTSPVQIHYMKKTPTPPWKMFTYGRVYRNDSDSTHTPMFHQVECLVVNETTNMIDLMNTAILILRKLFDNKPFKHKFVPSYFPFTSPSIECFLKFENTESKHNNKWLEILGAGMVHPKVMQNFGLDPTKYQGFAIGFGVERICMVKHNITDIRNMFTSDPKWLTQYGFNFVEKIL